MKIYFGGAEYPRAIKTLIDSKAKRVMFSFAAAPAADTWKLAGDMEVMLDSGAFSVWRRGRQIKLDDYMDYVSLHQPHAYLNLDVVGDWKSSLKNQEVMEQAGFTPIPVFHFGDPWFLLDHLSKSYGLIGLGGTVGLPFRQKKLWLEQVFTRHPDAGFHGLGITSAVLLSAFPFRSVDSTWWLFMYRQAGGRLTDETEHFRAEQAARVRHLLQYESSPVAGYQLALSI